jgi:hypothetical protein
MFFVLLLLSRPSKAGPEPIKSQLCLPCAPRLPRLCVNEIDEYTKKIGEMAFPGIEEEIRLLHLRKAYDLGYLILTGSLIGLPGQTNKDILNDILL